MGKGAKGFDTGGLVRGWVDREGIRDWVDGDTGRGR